MKRTVRQFDLIIFDASKIEKTAQGFWKIPARFTGVGVFPYRDPSNPKKIVRRLRSAVEVFKPESMSTLNDAPLTLYHPPEMVEPSNIDQYRKGHIPNPVEKEGTKYLKGFVLVESQDALDAIEKDGIKQLSCGYMASIDDTPGVYKDPETGEEQAFDDQQLDIVYNHCALVPVGRQGPDKSLLLDKKEFYFQDGIDLDIPQGGGEMKFKLIMLDGKEIEIEVDANKVPTMDAATFEKVHKEMAKAHEDAKEHEKHLRDMKTMCDDLKEKAEEAKADKKKAEDKAETLTAQVDSLKRDIVKVQKDAKPDPKTMATLVKARAVKLGVLAELVRDPKNVKDAAEWDDVKLMTAVIVADAKADGQEVKLEGKSDEYIQATYDHIERRLIDKLDTNAILGLIITEGRQEDTLGGILDPARATTHRRKAVDEGEIMEKKDSPDARRDAMEGKYKDWKPSASADAMRGRGPKVDEKSRDRAGAR